MSEFTLDTSIHKLIGTPGGYVGYGESKFNFNVFIISVIAFF